jgi:hypothetical protein
VDADTSIAIGSLGADMALLRGDVTDMRGEMVGLRTDLRGERGLGAELRGEIAQLRGEMADFRVEVRSELAESRRHTDVLFETLRDDIRILAEGFALLSTKIDSLQR